MTTRTFLEIKRDFGPLVDKALRVLKPKTPLPRDLFFALIRAESQGSIGEPAGVTTGQSNRATLPTSDGGEVREIRCLGLMQVSPALVKRWNSDNPKRTIYADDMRGTTIDAAYKQILVGIQAYIKNLNAVRRWWPVGHRWPRTALNEDHCALALVAYNFGIFSLRTIMSDTDAKTYDGLAKRYGIKRKWGKSMPLYYTHKILRLWRRRGKWPWARKKQSPPEKQNRTTSVLTWLAVGAIGYLVMRGR